MTKTYSPERFRELCAEFKKQEESILDWKGGEYSTEDDRIQNFREIAEFIGSRPVEITPAVVAFMYMLKHVQSIKNALVADRVDWRWETEGGEGTKQRVADVRNYLLLLSACMDEQAEARARQEIEVKLRRMGAEEMPMMDAGRRVKYKTEREVGVPCGFSDCKGFDEEAIQNCGLRLSHGHTPFVDFCEKYLPQQYSQDDTGPQQKINTPAE